MAVKLDINKAYDRVEWEFLRQIMLRIGLPIQWVTLAMETVKTATYSVLINGNQTVSSHQPTALGKETHYPYISSCSVLGVVLLDPKGSRYK